VVWNTPLAFPVKISAFCRFAGRNKTLMGVHRCLGVIWMKMNEMCNGWPVLITMFALRWKSIFSQKPTNRPPKFNWENSRPYTPTSV
jgi:hypothetical protein